MSCTFTEAKAFPLHLLWHSRSRRYLWLKVDKFFLNICLWKSVKILWKNDRWSILNSHWEYEIGVLAIQRIYTIFGVDFYRLINHSISWKNWWKSCQPNPFFFESHIHPTKSLYMSLYISFRNINCNFCKNVQIFGYIILFTHFK